MRDLTAIIPRYEMLRDVRGKGLMIGIEFGPPDSFRLKASWSVLETANKGLFCQLITIPLFKEQKILCQVAGHASHTIKLLPAFVITDKDCDWIVRAFDEVIAGSHRVPGAVWSLGKTLVTNATRGRKPARSPVLRNPRSFDSNPGLTPHSEAFTRQIPVFRLSINRPVYPRNDVRAGSSATCGASGRW